MSANYYHLRVLRLEGLQWRRPLHRRAPDLYVEVKLGDVVQKTPIIKKSVSPSWNANLVFPPPDESASFEIRVKHSSLWSSDPCIGSLNVKPTDLLTKCAAGEARFDLRSASSSFMGTVALHIENVDPTAAVGISIETAEGDVQRRGIATSDRALDVMEPIAGTVNQASSQGDLHRAIGELLSKLSVFRQAMDALAEVHPFLTIAWKLTSALFVAAENVFKADIRIVDLVHSMDSAFAFVRDVQTLPDRAGTLQRPIDGLLKQTIECCFFIQKYIGRGFLGRALEMEATQKIDEFERALANFKKEIDSGVNLFTAFVSLRLSRGINEILLRQRLDPSLLDGSDRPVCLPETRTELRNNIIEWAFSETTQNTLWLYGVAGSGKSTVSTTIANHLRDISRLGAFLFFERGKSEPSSVIRTIAYQLGLFDSSIGTEILSETETDKGIASASLVVQFNRLLLQPLHAIADSMTGPIVIVLDALDECGTVKNRSSLMKLFHGELPKLPSIFRFLIMSRREVDIDKFLSSRPLNVLAMELDCVSVTSQNDVLHYLRTEMFNAVSEVVEIPEAWPWDGNLSLLGKVAGGLFIWASTAVKMVQNSDSPFYQLDCIVSDSRLLSSAGMDALYATVLRNSGIAWENDRSKDRFVKVLSLLFFGKTPLSSKAIDGILGFPPHETSLLILSRLRSVVSYTEGGLVSLSHASFSDYLLSPERSSDPWFIDVSMTKLFITERCFSVMEHLRFNMCDLESSFLLNDDVQGLTGRVRDRIPPYLEYACLYWTHHLLDVPYSSDLQYRLSDFADRRLLYWFETLSLVKTFFRTASRALSDAANWVEPHNSEAASFFRDASILANTFAPAIAHSTPHIYVSMIPLSGDESQVSAHYSTRMSSMVWKHVQGTIRPPMYVKVMDGHRGLVSSVAFAPDGTRIVSGSQDQTIRIWNLDGKEITMPLTCHSAPIFSVAFSPDGKRIVAGSWDGTLSVWDVENGTLTLGPLEGHTAGIFSVAWSPDGATIASGSTDNTIILWDAANGKTISTPLARHTDDVRSVAFSPDGSRLVSGSSDKTIIIWDVESRTPAFEPLEGHSHWVNSVAFAPNGKHLVSGSADKTIKIWELENRRVMSILGGDTLGIMFVAYSPCGTRIVSGSGDEAVRIWDAETGKVTSGPLKGHSDTVWSVAWSPDGRYIVSGSADNTVRIWDATTTSNEPETSPMHRGPIMSLVFSPDGNRVASASQDKSIIVWDVQNGKITAGPFLGHRDTINCITFSLDGSRLFSGSDDKTIRVWDTETGQEVTNAQETQSDVTCIALSPDGTMLVSGSRDKTVRVWEVTSSRQLTRVADRGPLNDHSATVKSLAFSPDGKQLASSSGDRTIILWDTETWGRICNPLTGHTSRIWSVSYSSDGTRILSSSDDEMIIWDVTPIRPSPSHHTIGASRIISGHNKGDITSALFSPNGKFIISCFTIGPIRLWDAETCQPIHEHALDGHVCFTLSLSPDGSRLASGSSDNTLRIWDVSDLLNDGDARTTSLPTSSSHTNTNTNTNTNTSKPSNWALGNSGWVVLPNRSNQNDLLLWIPPSLRRTLWRPRNTAVLSCDFSTRLDFTDAAVGPRWTECFSPF